MTVKFFEIRDHGTFIPAMGVKPDNADEQERYLLSRAGYGHAIEDHMRYVILVKIDGSYGKWTCDPYKWGDRTLQVAHDHIINHWDTLQSGDVIDVEFILGERPARKVSERLDFFPCGPVDPETPPAQEGS